MRISGFKKVIHQNLRNDHVDPDFEAICHILVEHGHIHFSIEHGHFSNFLMEHGRFSNFGGTLSFLLFLVEHGPFSNFLAPVISLPLHSD